MHCGKGQSRPESIMGKFSRDAGYQVRRFVLLGIGFGVLVVMLIADRLSAAEFSLLLVGIAIADVLSPQTAQDAAQFRRQVADEQRQRRYVDRKRGAAARLTRAFRAGLGVLAGCWVAMAAILILGYASDMHVPVVSGGDVSGIVLVIVALQVALAGALWNKRRRGGSPAQSACRDQSQT